MSNIQAESDNIWGGGLGVEEMFVQLPRTLMSNKLSPFISTASVRALQWSSIYIMILHLYNGGGHFPHCPPFLQMYDYWSLEASSVGDCTLSVGQQPRQRDTGWADLYWQLRQWWQAQSSAPTPGAGDLQAMDVPRHLLSFLPIHPAPTPACSLFLAFPLRTSPSLTPGPVSWVCSWEWSPCPHTWTCFPSHFPAIFQLLFPSFPYSLPQRLKVSKVDATEKSAAIGNDRWPFTMLPICIFAYLILMKLCQK